MAKIEHRRSPEALPDEALLPSQRALLEMPVPYSRIERLGHKATNHLGEFLSYDLTVVHEEAQRKRVATKGPENSDYYRQEIHELSILSTRLLRSGPDYDPYEGMDRTQVKIIDRTNAHVFVRDNYEQAVGELSGYNPKYGTFTPQGLVYDPPEDFRQRIVVVNMENEHLFAEDAWFNFSEKGHLYLYTDNLSAEIPHWEYFSHSNVPNTFPSRQSEPYFFHAVPARFTSDELALSAITQMTRILATSTQEQEAREAAYQEYLASKDNSLSF